jgi:hypothetical protein
MITEDSFLMIRARLKILERLRLARQFVEAAADEIGLSADE